jgi:CRISPR-associated endonuclease/helicase Cas3
VSTPTFNDLFAQAFGVDTEGGTLHPFPYQEALATNGPTAPRLLRIPTGLGKTAAVVLAWVWRRRFAERDVQTPRRLVYCLPMRTLVEQTYTEVIGWLDRLGLLAGKIMCSNYVPDPADGIECGWSKRHGDHGTGRIAVHLLMGGEERTDWALWPERDAILVGTQDMLLSRALNRGYAARQSRWPREFGLLNNDCLWVFDEVQLMGPGLATGLQLEAFRSAEMGGKKYFDNEKPCVSWYMSATASRRLLTSREWRDGDSDKRPPDFLFELSHTERADTTGVLARRRLAMKQIECQPSWTLQDADAARRILQRHQQMLHELNGSPTEVPRRTLVICNTVDRARAIHSDMAASFETDRLVLLHSRFRPPDRARQQERLKAAVDAVGGQIVIATQIIEAGLDLSAAVLWTEVAPLPSIVQRLGRLNRAGEFGHDGISKYGWIPVAVSLGVPLPRLPPKPTKDDREKHDRATTRAYLPYGRSECESAHQALVSVTHASPANLDVQLGPQLDRVLHPPDYSLQRHELLDFFDTDSNLSLGYTDASPFVRGIDPETDVYVLWREWEGDAPPFRFDVGRDEMCHVPVWHVTGKNGLHTWRQGFIWQGREKGWQPASHDNLLPGATLLLPADASGYDQNLGWTGNSANGPVAALYTPLERPTDEDLLSNLEHGWQSIESHTADVRTCWIAIYKQLDPLADAVATAIDEAIRWHDYGKSVRRWQAATRLLAWKARLEWPRNIAPIAKFSFSESPLVGQSTGAELRRVVSQLRTAFAPKLRHEVASALAIRAEHRQNGHIPATHQILAEYLVMSHHGYVRKTLRDELPRDPRRIRRAPDEVRGIREGAQLPGFTLDGKPLPATDSLSIACRQMGRAPDGSESWTRSVLRLVDHFGPFRLAYYESLVRAADCRASAEPQTDVMVAKTRATINGSGATRPDIGQ